MARSTYSPDDLGSEIVAPSGYYQPFEEGFLDYEGKQLLYTLGSACIEASCCGKGSWSYARVEGYVVGDTPPRARGDGGAIEIDTVEDVEEKTAIANLLAEKHPGVRVEFR